MIKLRYKIAIFQFVIGCAIVLISTMAHQKYLTALTHQEAKKSLQTFSNEISHQINMLLKEKAAKIQTLASSPIIAQLLAESNAEYSSLLESHREEYINNLNQRWIQTQDCDDPFLQSYLRNPVAEHLSTQFDLQPGEYGEIFLTNRYGSLVSTTAKLTTFFHGQKYWWQACYNGGQGKIFFDDRGFDVSSASYVLGIVVPIHSDGHIIGILKANINIVESFDEVLHCSAHTSRQSMIVRQQARVVLQRDTEPLSTELNLAIRNIVHRAQSLTYEEDGIPFFAAISPIAISYVDDTYGFGGQPQSLDHRDGNKGEGWSIVTTQTVASALQLSRQTSQYFYYTNTLLVLLLAMIALYVGKRVSKPLVDASSAMAKIATGDFNVKLNVPFHDELGAVLQSINDMAGKLSTTMATKDQYSTELEQRKQAENVLRAERDFTKSIIDTAQIIILVLDTEGRVQTFNPYMEELLGYPLAEVAGCDWFSTFLPHDEYLRIKEVFKHAVGDIHTKGTTNKVLSKDGDELYIEWSNETLRNQDGEALGMLAIGRDITEQKRSKEALQESEARYRRLTDNALDMIYRMAIPSGVYEYVSPAVVQIFGYSVRALYENSSLVEKAIHPDWQDYFATQWQNLLVGNMPTSYEYQIIDKSGVTKWLNQRNVLITDNDGQPIAIEGIVTDVSDSKEAEGKRLELEKQLRQKHKMEAVGYMAGGMAHNFNNNLSIILGNIELMQMKQQSNLDPVPLLQNAKTAVLRSRDLIQKITTYSRQSVQVKGQVLIAEIIAETVTLLQSTLPASVILSQVIAPECDSIFIDADASQIQEVLINLCNNAIHAMAEKGELQLSLHPIMLEEADIPEQYNQPAGHYLRLSVQDNGCGMTVDVQERMFDPFFTTKEDYEGAGMGLATVQGIVNQHGGIIKVNSDAGQGTEFSLYFPVVSQTDHLPATQEQIPLTQGSERILFVDDDPILADLGALLLGSAGYKVVTMTSSIEALALFKANADSFDVIISDQTMPGLSGTEFIQQIKAMNPEIPTILCTGYSSTVDGKIANDLNISAFLMKPLELVQLSQTVRKVLDDRQSMSF